MTVKSRLIIFAKSKEKSVRAFEVNSGLTLGYINAIRVSIQPDKLTKIISKYPDLSLEWLITGNGAMLKGDEALIDSERIVFQKRIIELMTEIDRLKSELQKK